MTILDFTGGSMFLIERVLESKNLSRNTSLAAPGALAHPLQGRSARNTSSPDFGRRGPKIGQTLDYWPQNGRLGLESGPPKGFWGLPSSFAK